MEYFLKKISIHQKMLQMMTFMFYFTSIIHSLMIKPFFPNKFDPVKLSLASNLLKSPKFIQNVVTSKVKTLFRGSINLFLWFLSQSFAITSFTLHVLMLLKRFPDQNNWYLVSMKAQPSGLACNKNDWKEEEFFKKWKILTALPNHWLILLQSLFLLPTQS